MFEALDPVLHSQMRLAIMSVLINVKSADFSFLLECTKATKGNLSFQLDKLKAAGYVEVTKTKKGNYPLTLCNLTEEGVKAYSKYVDDIESYFKAFRDKQ